MVKSTTEISQNFVAFSECMNFNLEFQEEWEGRGTLQKQKRLTHCFFSGFFFQIFHIMWKDLKQIRDD